VAGKPARRAACVMMLGAPACVRKAGKSLAAVGGHRDMRQERGTRYIYACIFLLLLCRVGARAPGFVHEAGVPRRSAYALAYRALGHRASAARQQLGAMAVPRCHLGARSKDKFFSATLGTKGKSAEAATFGH
jgi:hypothetical protein